MIKRHAIIVIWKRAVHDKSEGLYEVYTSLAVFAKATKYEYSRNRINTSFGKSEGQKRYDCEDFSMIRVPLVWKNSYKDELDPLHKPMGITKAKKEQQRREKLLRNLKPKAF